MKHKQLKSNTRETIRAEVMKWFLKEPHGIGTGDSSSKQIYVVEKYDKYRIELKRPGMKHAGDFIVSVNSTSKNIVEFHDSKNNNCPKFDDIIRILKDFMEANNATYEANIKPLIKDIYNCKKINFDNLNSLGTFKDIKNNNIPIEIVLLSIKWIFIEEDMNYWNYSGRTKFFNELTAAKLV